MSISHVSFVPNKMKKCNIFISVLMILSQFSRGKKHGTARVEVINGITYIHCSDQPSHPKRSIHFEEELTIGEEQPGEEIILYQPGPFTVDNNDNI